MHLKLLFLQVLLSAVLILSIDVNSNVKSDSAKRSEAAEDGERFLTRKDPDGDVARDIDGDLYDFQDEYDDLEEFHDKLMRDIARKSVEERRKKDLAARKYGPSYSAY